VSPQGEVPVAARDLRRVESGPLPGGSSQRKDLPLMSHRNAPLSFEGRLCVVQRCEQRPISHVAAEMGISRACASKWVNRWRRHGELGLHDRPSTPHHSPDATPAWVIERIETWWREKKWSANRITHELAELDFRINRRTVTRHLTRLGLGQRRFIDPSGHSNRKPGKIIARWPGHMAHLDVKKVGWIPDGGGWRIHGRNSAQKRAVDFPVPEPRPDPNAVVLPDGSLQLTRDPGRTWRERSPSREVHRPGREAIAKNKPPLSLRIPRRCRGQLRPDGETANVCQRQRGSEWAVRKGLTVPGTRGPPRQ
jgi:transposase